jgi:hypothetical protein
MKTFSPARTFFFVYGAIIITLCAAVMLAIVLKTPAHVIKLREIAAQAEVGARRSGELRREMDDLVDYVGIDEILKSEAGGRALLDAGLRIQGLECRENFSTR